MGPKQNPMDHFCKQTEVRTCKTLNSLCSLHHTTESHSGEPPTAMYWEWTEDHSAAWAEPWTSRAWNSLWTLNQGWGACRTLNNELLFFLARHFFLFNLPWWTLVSLTLCFLQHLKYFTDIILEALGLFDWCSHDCVCCNELPTSQLDDGNSMGNDGCKDLTI